MGALEFQYMQDATALIIAMLGCLELDMEVSDAGMETTESNDCRRVFRKDGDANSIVGCNVRRSEISCKDR